MQTLLTDACSGCPHPAGDHDGYGCLDSDCPCQQSTGKAATITYCRTCRRIRGIGCACGMTFKEKVQGVAAQVPDNMRAVPRTH